jgi:transposase
MLSFPGSMKVFIGLDPIDMRAGINTLHSLVASKFSEDARDGALFAYTNKSRRLLKVLYWDGTGMWLMTKRLEQGHVLLAARHRRAAEQARAAPRSLQHAHRRHRHARRKATRLV